MTDWLHCNTCFRQPGDGIGFCLTNCGHVYCDKCVRVACVDKCSMCGSVCDKITLSSKMKPDVEMFFTNPLDMLKKDTKKFIQVMEFQQNHRRRFLEHLRDKIMKQESFLQKAQRIVSHYQELERELEKTKEENLYLKRLMTEKGLAGHGRPLTPGKQYSPASRGSPGFLHPSSTSINAISSGRLSGRTPPSSGRQGSPAYHHQGPTSSISSGRLSIRTPPSGGRIGTVQETPPQRSSSLPHTPKSVPHPISLSGWRTPD